MGGARTKSSMKNVGYGLGMQLITMLVNFILRTVLVRTLGRDINGLNGLFTEVIAMLSLVEMGVGSAITYNLFKPLAEGDEEKLCQLMTLFKKAYRIIAAAVLCIGLLLVPVIQYLVNGTDFSIDYIRLVFVLFVLQTASTYLFSYKSSLLIADQKNYVVNVITTLAKVALMVVNIVVLLTTHNFIAYLSVQIVFNLLTNVGISMAADKRYAFLHKKAVLPKEEQKNVLSNIKHIFIGTLSGKITNSTDNILISVLVNTAEVGIYSNYSMIMTSIKYVFIHSMNAMSGSIGNLLVSETPEHCNRVLKRLTMMFFVCGFIASAGMFCVAAPFVQLFFGADYLLNDTVLFICVINLYIFIIREPLWKVMNVSGLFAKDKNISIIGTGINLVVSLVLGKLLGMAGIFIGTTCTLVIQYYLKVILLYRERFAMPAKGFLIYIGKMTGLLCISLLVVKFLCDKIVFGSLIVMILVRGLVATGFTAVVILLFYAKSEEFQYFVNLLMQIIRKRLLKEVKE